jgi:ATP-dependent DNA helicase RecG
MPGIVALPFAGHRNVEQSLTSIFVSLTSPPMPDNAIPRPTQAQFWSEVGDQESMTVEFKQLLQRANRLQEPMVAFANSRGGTIIVGVGDRRPRQLLGVTWSQDLVEQVQEAARSTQPPLHVDVERRSVDGYDIALIHVQSLMRGWVQTSDGRLLVRAGPTNRALVGDELLRFVRERAADPVEDEPVPGMGIDDLRPELVRQYVRARLGRSKANLPDAARDLGLVTADGRIRLATLLMFGRDPQQRNRRFGIVVSRFEGSVDGEVRLRQRRELSGPLPALVAEADQQIYNEMRRDAVVRGLVREEVPEYPPVALREALVNAVGHRDYSLRGAAVEVRLYDDAVEVESPGTLAGYVTVENLREAQYSRNERIMDALQRLGLVEEAGQGIDRMIAEMEDALLDPPQFEERSASFVVRLRGGSVFAAEDRLWVSQLGLHDLAADGKVALVFARRTGAITNEQLRSLRRLDRDSSRETLQDLVARGLLEAFGRGRGTGYRLSELAIQARITATLSEQLRAVLNHARRTGVVVNADVRGLLGVDAPQARSLLETLVLRGLLRSEGERRGRRYLPVRRSEDEP